MSAGRNPALVALADRLGHDDPRRRTRAGNGGYSRFVGFMRYALPATAVILLSLVAIWPLFSESDETLSFTPDKSAVIDGTGRMNNVRYEGTDRKNRPFTVTAEETSRPDGTSSNVHLTTIAADMLVDPTQDEWLKLTADKGLYQRDADILDLEGNVTVRSDAGHELHTSTARIDLAAGTGRGNEPVTGTGPHGILNAGSFSFVNEGQTMMFEDRVRLLIYPAGRKVEDDQRS